MPKRRQTRADGRPRSGGQRPRGTSAGRPGGPGGRPGVADRPSAEGASETRRAVERFSARPLVFLTQLPRWALLAVVLGLLVSGFAVPGPIGAVLLVLVAILLGWLAYLSWPSLNATGRSGRIVALVCMVIIVVWQARR
jgi:uncharacterized RDD family membrane protein YckC